MRAKIVFSIVAAGLLLCGCGQQKVSGCGGDRPSDENIIAAIKKTYNANFMMTLTAVAADCGTDGTRKVLYEMPSGSPSSRQAVLMRSDDGKWHITTDYGTAEVPD